MRVSLIVDTWSKFYLKNIGIESFKLTIVIVKYNIFIMYMTSLYPQNYLLSTDHVLKLRVKVTEFNE